MSHSHSRVAHRGGRSPQDPDRRVKYIIRRFRRNGTEQVETRLVRRARRSEAKQVAPGQSTAERLWQRRRDRRDARDQLRQELAEQDAQALAAVDPEPVGDPDDASGHR
jgi:hypothetical protein